jgi:hypothetical protein
MEVSSPMLASHQTGGKTYPVELRALCERGQAGDATVLPELEKAFDARPDLAGMFGDMPKLAKEALLDAVAGPSLPAREATRRQSDRICGELAGWNAPAPVRLLAERVALTWIEVHHADLQMAEALKKRSLESSHMQAAERRAHAAQARFLAAIEALVRVRMLMQPIRPDWPTNEHAPQNGAGPTSLKGEAPAMSA